MRRYLFFFIMIIAGAGLGMYYAWVVHPVNYVDASLTHLRQDYKADYVLMAAEVFAKDQSVYNAMRRLDLLNEPSTEGAVFGAIQVAKSLGYSKTDLDLMEALYFSISGKSPTSTPVIDLTMAASFDLTKTPAVGTPQPDDGLIMVEMGVEAPDVPAEDEEEEEELALNEDGLPLILPPGVTVQDLTQEAPAPMENGFPPILPPGTTAEDRAQAVPVTMEEDDFFGGEGFSAEELNQLGLEGGL